MRSSTACGACAGSCRHSRSSERGEFGSSTSPNGLQSPFCECRAFAPFFKISLQGEDLERRNFCCFENALARPKEDRNKTKTAGAASWFLSVRPAPDKSRHRKGLRLFDGDPPFRKKLNFCYEEYINGRWLRSNPAAAARSPPPKRRRRHWPASRSTARDPANPPRPSGLPRVPAGSWSA